MILKVKCGGGEYPVFLERGGLEKVGEKFSLNRKCSGHTGSFVHA